MMCCYHPTTTIAIDDDLDFLSVITQHLGIANCISYSSPKKAIEFLQKQKSFQRIQARVLKTSNSSENITYPADDCVWHVNLHNLHQEVYFEDRFQDVSVIIVDYYMDEMRGIDVCEALINHPAKKILLTGGADKEKIAIEAFNKGIIHRFINKSDRNFPAQLKQAIIMLKDAYFRDLSSTLLPDTRQKYNNPLNNAAYTNFIRNLQDQFHAVEYYLIDISGSTLFLDANGTPIWLIVKHETELDEYIVLAKDQDGNSNMINRNRSQRFRLQ